MSRAAADVVDIHELDDRPPTIELGGATHGRTDN